MAWHPEGEGPDVEAFYLSEVLRRTPPGARILDVGTGSGHIPATLAEQLPPGARIVALDLSAEMIDLARARIGGVPMVSLVQGDGYTLPFPAASFDLVIHRLAPVSPSDAWRVLKPGGYRLFYGTGPFDWREVRVAFGPERLPPDFRDGRAWRMSTVEAFRDDGYHPIESHEYVFRARYTLDVLAETLAEAEVVTDYQPDQDRRVLQGLATRPSSEPGLVVTRHARITIGRKPLGQA